MPLNDSEIIKRLRSITLEDYPIGEVSQLIRSLSFPLIEVDLIVGGNIYRTRKGVGYKKRKQLTYRPVEYCKNAQRANLRNQTVFYGVVSDNERNYENAEFINICECSELARQGKLSVGREYFSVSRWRIIKPIHAVCIVSEDYYNRVNNKILEIAKDFCNKEFGKNKTAKQNLSFIAEMFCKPVSDGCDYEYLISASIADYILYQLNYDAILYPSVQAGGQAGMNIALKPTVADKKIYFNGIHQLGFYKNGENSFASVRAEYDSTFHRTAFRPSITEDTIMKSMGFTRLSDMELY